MVREGGARILPVILSVAEVAIISYLRRSAVCPYCGLEYEVDAFVNIAMLEHDRDVYNIIRSPSGRQSHEMMGARGTVSRLNSLWHALKTSTAVCRGRRSKCALAWY